MEPAAAPPPPPPPPAVPDDGPDASLARYTKIGFWVPMGIAIAASVAGAAVVIGDTSGYAGLIFLAYLFYGVPAIILWLIVGAIVVRSTGPRGAARRFSLGAAAAVGAAILLFAATCFASIAL